jgi:hypothetical protein
MFDDLKTRCDAVEECYEFMLAYAAQGLPSDANSASGAELRPLLDRAVDAISGIPAAYEAAFTTAELQPESRYRAYLAVLQMDAAASRAAMELVLAQPAISSMLIDNLNASIHLRALLTDLFLIDEIFKQYVPADDQTAPTLTVLA